MTTFTNLRPMMPSRRIRLAAAVRAERLPSGCIVYWVDWSKLLTAEDA